jgi:hypothetical protein
MCVPSNETASAGDADFQLFLRPVWLEGVFRQRAARLVNLGDAVAVGYHLGKRMGNAKDK